MSSLGHLTHFNNFARVHRATQADLPLLTAFSSRFPLLGVFWRQVVSDRHAYVLIATECQIIVGVCIFRHEPSAALAHLSWIGVESASRRRGVGTLLLRNAIGHVQSEGAAVIVAESGGRVPDLRALLVDHGFAAVAQGSDIYSLYLWNARQAQSYCDFPIPAHRPVEGCAGSACGLALAMATLDETVLFTPRVAKVLQHELSSDCQTFGEQISLALAAARRRFTVVLHGLDTGETMPEIPHPLSGLLRFESDPLTPERLVGYLSRRHLPLLQLHFPRINRDAPARWFLLTGFDGYLFCLVDVLGQEGAATVAHVVVTRAEMRQALGRAERAAGPIIASMVA